MLKYVVHLMEKYHSLIFLFRSKKRFIYLLDLELWPFSCYVNLLFCLTLTQLPLTACWLFPSSHIFVLFMYYVFYIELQVSVNIIEDYIILGGSEFLSVHASNIAKILDLVVGNVNDKGLLSVLPVIDILIQVFYFQVSFKLGVIFWYIWILMKLLILGCPLAHMTVMIAWFFFFFLWYMWKNTLNLLNIEGMCSKLGSTSYWVLCHVSWKCQNIFCCASHWLETGNQCETCM